MDKEKKKLLLVAVSVGVFLLVTITVGIIILTPKTQEAQFSTAVPYSSGRVQLTQQDDVSSQTTPSQPAVVSTEVDKKDGDNLTITIPSPTTAAVPDIAQISETKKSNERPVVATVKTTEPAPAVKPAAQTAVPKTTNTTTAKTKSSAVVKPSASVKTINDFWVQTGAFSAQVRAEDARETLATKGITSIVENREINGKIWYRVRLGPYTSEREANHWLEIVKLIDGFSDSQIRQTVRTN
ncbi:SPOR domain-containing protein [Treponema sp. R80B11-R83G3]